MKRTILFVLTTMLICSISYSQKITSKNILKGKITDEKTGAPLAGASIFIPELKVGAEANGNGSFSTSSLPAGKYLVELSKKGFLDLNEKIVNQDNRS